jgi:hypothetical protein
MAFLPGYQNTLFLRLFVTLSYPLRFNLRNPNRFRVRFSTEVNVFRMCFLAFIVCSLLTFVVMSFVAFLLLEVAVLGSLMGIVVVAFT